MAASFFAVNTRQPPLPPMPTPFRSRAPVQPGASASDAEVTRMIEEFLPAVQEYIAGLLAGEEGVDDLTQETGLFLWQKRDEFTAGTNFRAWALRIAWFKVMALRRDRAREGHVFFSDAMMERLAARAEERVDSSASGSVPCSIASPGCARRTAGCWI